VACGTAATDRGKARSVTQLLHYWRYYGNASVKRLADMHHYEQLLNQPQKNPTGRFIDFTGYCYTGLFKIRNN